jgi:hypothetical protein
MVTAFFLGTISRFSLQSFLFAAANKKGFPLQSGLVIIQ